MAVCIIDRQFLDLFHEPSQSPMQLHSTPDLTNPSTGPKQESSYGRKDNANSEEEWKDGLWCEDRSEGRTVST